MNLTEESVELNDVFAVELVEYRASPVFDGLLGDFQLKGNDLIELA